MVSKNALGFSNTFAFIGHERLKKSRGFIPELFGG
jgi:hypothetical protein